MAKYKRKLTLEDLSIPSFLDDGMRVWTLHIGSKGPQWVPGIVTVARGNGGRVTNEARPEVGIKSFDNLYDIYDMRILSDPTLEIKESS